ncbi:MAG: ComEC/Rec2 family competence protein, partial [Flavobacteriaceae bacterium]|nr:ComEC/Rec2 family competence protein [Flavobacteriaceae bacterium]
MIRLALFLILGIVLGALCNWQWKPSNTILVLVLFFLFVLLHYRSAKHKKFSFIPGVLVVLLTVVLGFFMYSMQLPKNRKQHFIHVIKPEHQILQLEVLAVLKPNNGYRRYEMKLHKVAQTSVEGKVLVYISKSADRLHIGDALFAVGRLQEVVSKVNPFGFDYARYLHHRSVYGRLYLKSSQFEIAKNKDFRWNSLTSLVRNRALKTLEHQQASDNEIAVIKALFLGDRTDLAEETLQNYRDAGVVHILAISGLHIGILLLFLKQIFSWLLPGARNYKWVLLGVLGV